MPIRDLKKCYDVRKTQREKTYQWHCNYGGPRKPCVGSDCKKDSFSEFIGPVSGNVGDYVEPRQEVPRVGQISGIMPRKRMTKEEYSRWVYEQKFDSSAIPKNNDGVRIRGGFVNGFVKYSGNSVGK
jgi:hypothetical protein